MNELTQQCLALPIAERERLIYALKNSLEIKKNIGSRYRELLKAATDILGNGIDSKSRDASCVMGRMFIAYKMRCEGWSLTQIGMMMGRDHATICHLQKKMMDVIEYPHCYKVEMAFWEEFNNKLKEDGIY
jgi:chromosomal replication initiation ATPase DnaA